MLKLIITKFWPALIPLALYVLWMLLRKRKAKKADEDIPRWLDGPWLWAVVASILIVIAGFFWLGLSSHSDSGSSYQPKEFKDGQLIEERLE